MTKVKKPVPKKPQPASGEQTVGPVTQGLIRARMLIAKPERHTRGAFGRKPYTPFGRNAATGPVPCAATDPEAICWCASGALRKVYGIDDFDSREGHPYKASMDLLAKASKEMMRQSQLGQAANCITVINDSLGHAGAMAMYNRAIILAKGA